MQEQRRDKTISQVWARQVFPFAAVIGLAGVVFLSGCATTGEIPTPSTGMAKKGVYHKIAKGETLWRVAQAYNVDVDDIIAVNRIPNAALLEEGQLVLIPGADSSVARVALPVKSDANASEFVWPVQGRLVEYFGERKGTVTSKGIGIAANDNAKVSASRQGKVVFADYLSGYAYTVILDHSDGYCSVYSQNSRVLVQVGDQVSKGDPIAAVGRKGILHFEIRRNTVAENPLHYLSKT